MNASSSSSAPAPVALARATAVFGSTVGKKAVMAATGLVLFGFVVGHMAGNLQVFLGPQAINDYALALRQVGHGGALWLARAGLLLAVALHIWAATSLTRTSWAARPVGYRRRESRESTYASRTMRWSGPLLALFIAYHLAHLTLGSAHPRFVEGDVYHNVIAGFRVWPVTAFYVLAQLALGLHLYHGIWSMMQSLGLSHPRYDGVRFAFSAFTTAVVVAGNVAIPVAVLTGFLR